MPTGMFEYRTEAERKAIERAIAFVAEMHDLALTAPSGQVLDQCEQQATERGRDLLQNTLQEVVQTRVDAAEVKKGRPGNANAGAPSTTKGGASEKS
jgi:hypothetical protein